MMEKRTQLAMLLVAIILGVNLMITARYQKQRQPAPGHEGASAPAAVTPERPEVGGPSTPPPVATPFPVAADTDGDVVVETPLQRFRISRAGAQIQEITLH